MPISTGPWKLIVNGQEGVLLIQSESSDGTLTASAFIDWQLKGSFNEVSQMIILTATVGGFHIGTFTGCLFRTPLLPAPGQDVVATLLGQVLVSHYTDLGGNHPIPWTARRNVYGWMATVNEVV